MRICFVSSEVAPFSKTGGLADVAGALPLLLSEAGHDVLVISPLHNQVRDHALDEVIGLVDIEIPIGTRTEFFGLWRSADQKLFHFVDAPHFFDRPAIYSNSTDEHQRWIMLTRAAFATCQWLEWAPDIIHLNDWQTALAPLYLRSVYGWDQLFESTRTVFTIHNLGYQGVFGSDIIDDLGLEDNEHLLHQDHLKAGRISFMEHALLYADRITTVSPTYAWEIQTPQMGVGLDGLLRLRTHDLVGILNGVDDDEWNPRTDRYIPFHYSVKSLWRKEKNKEALSMAVGLEYEKGVPLLGIVSRLAGQKGIELLIEPLKFYLKNGRVRFVALGSGEQYLEKMLDQLATAFPGRAAFVRGYDNPMAHLIEAGCDMFLMPSLYEPSGLNQMYSLAYGTAPVVRKTGGLADTVTHYDADTGEGNGFVFENFSSVGLGWALGQALDVYENKAAWQQLQRNGMAEDNSWEQRAHEYESLYASLMADAS